MISKISLVGLAIRKKKNMMLSYINKSCQEITKRFSLIYEI